MSAISVKVEAPAGIPVARIYLPLKESFEQDGACPKSFGAKISYYFAKFLETLTYYGFSNPNEGFSTLVDRYVEEIASAKEEDIAAKRFADKETTRMLFNRIVLKVEEANPELRGRALDAAKYILKQKLKEKNVSATTQEMVAQDFDVQVRKAAVRRLVIQVPKGISGENYFGVRTFLFDSSKADQANPVVEQTQADYFPAVENAKSGKKKISKEKGLDVRQEAATVLIERLLKQPIEDINGEQFPDLAVEVETLSMRPKKDHPRSHPKTQETVAGITSKTFSEFVQEYAKQLANAPAVGMAMEDKLYDLLAAEVMAAPEKGGKGILAKRKRELQKALQANKLNKIAVLDKKNKNMALLIMSNFEANVGAAAGRLLLEKNTSKTRSRSQLFMTAHQADAHAQYGECVKRGLFKKVGEAQQAVASAYVSQEVAARTDCAVKAKVKQLTLG